VTGRIQTTSVRATSIRTLDQPPFFAVASPRKINPSRVGATVAFMENAGSPYIECEKCAI
jgi:hypothetical protein